MLTAAQVEQFHRDGFVKGGRILDPARVDVLRSELERVISNQDGPGPQPARISDIGREGLPIYQIVNIWQASEPFRELIAHPTICEEIAQLTGSGVLRVWHDQIQFKPAERGGVNMWHQDAPLWPVLAPMTEVSAWVALDDVDESNGCMSMVPGSHRWGNHIELMRSLPDWEALPSECDGHPVIRHLCPVASGEVHFHHALTWHGSHANRSGRPRRALAIHFLTEETRFVASGQHPIKHLIEVGDGEVIQGRYFPQVWPVPAA